MDYNNYYPGQQPPVPNQIMPGSNNMMHPSPSPHNMRQVITPIHQQMQQQQQQPPPQPLAHHAALPMPHQQHHPNYHQLPPHRPPPHSGSPHPQAQSTPMHQQAGLNIQPPPRPSTGPSPQQHGMHQQSHHHMTAGPPTHPQQQLNQMGGNPNVLLPPIINQSQSSMQQHPHQQQVHDQNYLPHGPIAHPNQHYSQPPPLQPSNQHHLPPPPPPPQPQINQPPPTIPMHHGPPSQPPPQAYIPSVHHHPITMGRCSPFYQSIPQTEFRIIELNKRLQNRPRLKGLTSPLPLLETSEESYWWEKFANDFFDDDSTLTWRVPSVDKPDEYKIGRTLIPRFFRSYFDGGVTDLAIKLRNIRETAHNHLIILECDQTDITTKNILKHPAANMPMNVVVHTEGHLHLEFVSNSFDSLLIKSWRFYANQSREYIDRSMTTFDLPNACLGEPVTRNGLTKSTIFYLKMCMIMEPMQDLMLQHRQTKMDPRSCLKHLLVNKYKLKNIEDNRAQPNKRRKRKAPNATGTTKKSKANANNTNLMNNNNIGFNNIDSSLMSPSNMGGGMPNLSLASQDVMVVGEPSMLGADFGDENERRITRLENNQFDSSLSGVNSNVDNSMIQNQSQICNNANNSLNQHSRMQQQQNNNDTGNSNIQSMNHTSSNNNINSNNGTIDTTGGSSANCLQNNNNNNNNNTNNNNNHHHMNLVTLNGGTNHMGHIVKTEIDMKLPTASPATNDSETR